MGLGDFRGHRSWLPLLPSILAAYYTDWKNELIGYDKLLQSASLQDMRMQSDQFSAAPLTGG